MKRLIQVVMLMAVLAGTVFADEPFCSEPIKPEHAKLYKIDINQITPDSGITGGHIIAYGHYIKPPYKFEIREMNNDTILFVNNVQIEPRLKAVVYVKQEEVSLECSLAWEKEQRATKWIRENYKILKEKFGKDEALRMVAERYSDSAEYYINKKYGVHAMDDDNGKIQIGSYSKGKHAIPDVFKITYAHPIPDSTEVRLEEAFNRRIALMPKIPKKGKWVAEKESYEGSAKGALLILPFNGGIREYAGQDIYDVVKIMTSNLSNKNKQKAFIDNGTAIGSPEAKEIIYNFTTAEYPKLKDLEDRYRKGPRY